MKGDILATFRIWSYVARFLYCYFTSAALLKQRLSRFFAPSWIYCQCYRTHYFWLIDVRSWVWCKKNSNKEKDRNRNSLWIRDVVFSTKKKKKTFSYTMFYSPGNTMFEEMVFHSPTQEQQCLKWRCYIPQQ